MLVPDSLADDVISAGVHPDDATLAVPFTASSNAGTDISDRIALFDAGSAASAGNDAWVIAALNGDDVAVQAGATAVLVSGSAGSSTAYVWYVDNAGPGTVEAGEVSLVALVNLASGDINSFGLNSLLGT